MKTNKAMKARFKVTGTGKLVRHKQGRKHILTKKSSAKKRSLARPLLLSKTHAAKYKRMMGA
jgi:large subunit ribosomal protein L35